MANRNGISVKTGNKIPFGIFSVNRVMKAFKGALNLSSVPSLIFARVILFQVDEMVCFLYEQL